MQRFLTFILLTSALYVQAALAFETFTIRDIRVEGLQRISLGTVLLNLPLKVGDTVTSQETIQQALRNLYRSTGFFHEVSFSREGGALIIVVRERPSIAEVTIKGNDDISKDDLNQALRVVGMVEGRVFNRSILEKVEQELRTQYFERGKYSVELKTTVTPLERNRVSIAIDIREGENSRIQTINIVGSAVFSEEKLLSQMNLRGFRWYVPWSDASKYSKQKLAADLEILRSYYLDRGYIDFKVVSSQVSISNDKKNLYITINLDEGERYTLSKVSTTMTEAVIPQPELESLVGVKAGDIFSRKELTATVENISKHIGEEGYAFASIDPIPQIDSDAKTVAINFRVTPGSRVYVRRITISNNVKTRDDVIRREIRQMEGSLLSSEQILLSRQRLMRLGYFDDVSIAQNRVQGTSDQMDMDFKVAERSSGTFTGGFSYSPEQSGFSLNFSLQQDNFLGTGTNTTIAINQSEASDTYNFSFTNPYANLAGVSHTVSLYYRKYDPTSLSLVSYATDNQGANLSYSIPINELNSMSLGLNLENTLLNTTAETPDEIMAFVGTYTNNYELLYLTGGWRRDTRDNAIFAHTGSKSQLSLKASMPGSTLEFYKLTLNQNNYFPMGSRSTLVTRAEINYGGVYGTTTTFPYFENFYSGGPESVRGFGANRLGPRGTLAGAPTTDALGGAFETVASVEYLFPMKEDESSMRAGVFVDVGNVFVDAGQFDAAELRASVGVGVVWLTPIGALKFSYARPLMSDPAVDIFQPLQFTIGLPF